ncbi:MAG: hypothetical protein DRJ02_09010 [Bacteroidetes bacterium]|nr:MAG: hypothetical protein DRJ02_09010 [Bacteroidota bacterium]
MIKKITCFFLSFILLSVGGYAGQIDTLERQLQTAKDTNRVKILCDLCWEYRFVSANKALEYGNEALALAQELKYTKGIAQSYNDMGIIFIDQGNYQKAIEWFNKSLAIRTKLQDSAGMAALYNKIGIVYQKKGQLKKALENQIEALKIYENLGSDLWIGYSLNNMAIIHQNLGNLDKALQYHQKALTYRIKMGDVYGEAGSYGNMANVYVKLHDTSLAIQYYDKALTIFRKIDDKESISAMLNNLGNIYIARGKESEALPLLEESLKIRENLGDKKGIASTLLRMGEAYTSMGSYKKASQALYRARRLAREIDVVEEEMVSYLNLAKMYALQHQLDSAFKNMSLYIATKDSVYNQRLEEQIIDVQTRYETEKMGQDMNLLKSEKELTELRLKQKRMQNLLLILVIITIVGAAIFSFYRRKLKQKAAMDAAKIRYNEQKIRAVIESQEEEQRRIARELHDGVGQKLAGLKLNWSSLISGTEIKKVWPDYNNLTLLIDETAQEVRTISHQMLPKELEQFGLIPSIESLLEINFKNTGTNTSFSHMGVEERLPYTVELTIYRILQELVSNILKHAHASSIKVELLKRRDRILLIVEDDGIGMNLEKMKNGGIGVMNIESRVESVQGRVTFESEPEKGTFVTVNIPL